MPFPALSFSLRVAGTAPPSPAPGPSLQLRAASSIGPTESPKYNHLLWYHDVRKPEQHSLSHHTASLTSPGLTPGQWGVGAEVSWGQRPGVQAGEQPHLFGGLLEAADNCVQEVYAPCPQTRVHMQACVYVRVHTHTLLTPFSDFPPQTTLPLPPVSSDASCPQVELFPRSQRCGRFRLPEILS